MRTAPIIEVFESIQGEGKGIGTPSIFVRFWGCNLRCQFAGSECDTPYAVSREKENAVDMTPEELADKIKTYKSKNIVFTGGEPTLYQTYITDVMSNLNQFLTTDEKEYYTAEVETNATIPLDSKFRNSINQFNMSVKLSSSNQLNKDYDKIRYSPKAIKTFPIKRSHFKFVIDNENDIKEVIKISSKFPDFEVYLMPQGMTRKDIIKNSQMVAKLCTVFGYKFSPREHIIIWDNKRGV